jgi:hypothetical protein
MKSLKSKEVYLKVVNITVDEYAKEFNKIAQKANGKNFQLYDYYFDKYNF